jgi:hypothetical protein
MRVLSAHLPAFRCSLVQIRAPLLPAPLLGEYGAVSRSLLVRVPAQLSCLVAHQLLCVCVSIGCSSLRAQAMHELTVYGRFTNVIHVVRMRAHTAGSVTAAHSLPG